MDSKSSHMLVSEIRQFDFDSLKALAADLYAFMEKYRSFANMHVVQFFTTPVDEVMPSAFVRWCDSYDNLQSLERDLLKITQFDYQIDMPAEIVGFILDIRRLSFDRRCTEIVNLEIQRNGVKEKKLHEMSRLSRLIMDVRGPKAWSLMDIGCGQGHLASFISETYNVNVLGLDKDNYSSRAGGGVCIRQMSIDTSDIAPMGLEGKTLLYTLHGCGDLSSYLVRQLVHNDRVAALVLVGCCYNLLTEQKNDGRELNGRNHYGFPLSIACKNMSIGRNLLQLACQSLTKYSGAESLDSWKTVWIKNLYRSWMHKLMVEYGLCKNDASPTIGRVNIKSNATFSEYVRLVEAKHPEISFPCSKEIGRFADRLSTIEINRLRTFWTLRSMIGGVIESLIVLDRFVYLQEQRDSIDLACELKMAFDPSISPRNIAIVAVKK